MKSVEEIITLMNLGCVLLPFTVFNYVPIEHCEFRTQKAQRGSTSVKIRGGGKGGKLGEGD